MAFRRRDGRRDKGAPIRIAVDALAILAVLWVVGLFWYASQIAKTTPSDAPDQTATADAVIVLTGSTDRLTTGFELLAAGRAQRLFISGVYRGVDVQQILRALRRSPSEARNAIVLGYGADDTAGNAQETSVWMAKEGLTSLILVTSNFHMPRALVEFHAAMPQVTIVPRATASPSFKIDDWWWWPGTIRLIASEWTKYIGARARVALGIRTTPRALVSPAPMEPFAVPEPEAGPMAPPAGPAAGPPSEAPSVGPGLPQPGPVPPDPPVDVPGEPLPESVPDTLPTAPDTPSVPRPAAPEPTR